MKKIATAVTVLGAVIVGVAAAYAQNGEYVWCCKKTITGGTACQCQMSACI